MGWLGNLLEEHADTKIVRSVVFVQKVLFVVVIVVIVLIVLQIAVENQNADTNPCPYAKPTEYQSCP